MLPVSSCPQLSAICVTCGVTGREKAIGTRRKFLTLSVGVVCAASLCATLAVIVAPPSSGHVYPVAEVALGWKRNPAAWANRQVNVRGTIVYYKMARGGLTNWQSSALPDAVPIGYYQIPAGYRAVVVVAPDGMRPSATGMPPLSLDLMVRLQPRFGPVTHWVTGLHSLPLFRGIVPVTLQLGRSSVYRVRLGSLCPGQTPVSCSGFAYDGAVIVS